MNSLLILPILIPLMTAIVLLLLWGRVAAQRTVNIVGAAALCAAALALLFQVVQSDILVIQLGNWPAPFGITFVADLFSAIMVAITGLMGLVVAVASLGSIDAKREQYGSYPLLHTLLMGVSGAFLTGDLCNLFVWYEVMLMASFVMMALGGARAPLEGAIK